MDWSFANVLKFSYWLAIATPPLRQLSFIVLLIILVLVFALGIVLRVGARQRRRTNPPLAKGLQRLARPFFFFALLGLFLVFTRQMGAAVLSARIWLAAVFIIALVWGIWVARLVWKTYPAETQRLEELRKYQAYLPKRKT